MGLRRNAQRGDAMQCMARLSAALTYLLWHNRSDVPAVEGCLALIPQIGLFPYVSVRILRKG